MLLCLCLLTLPAMARSIQQWCGTQCQFSVTISLAGAGKGSGRCWSLATAMPCLGIYGLNSEQVVSREKCVGFVCQDSFDFYWRCLCGLEVPRYLVQRPEQRTKTSQFRRFLVSTTILPALSFLFLRHVVIIIVMVQVEKVYELHATVVVAQGAVLI